MSFKKDLKNVMILYPELELKSKDDYKHLINIHNIVDSVFGSKDNFDLVKTSFDNKENLKLNNVNDYYYLVFRTAFENQKIKKVAYPQVGSDLDINDEYDLSKWAELVYKTFQAVNSGDMSLDEALDYYSNTLDKKNHEDDKFKKWVRYYQTGEHLKYNKDKSNIKTANFQFPLIGPGFYGSENAIVPKDLIPSKKNNSVDNLKEKKDEFVDWRSKLHAAIRKIDKLLRQSDEFIELDLQKDLADLLHQFDQEVRSLRYEKTASDLAFKYAKKFKKVGFSKGHDEFMKYAQEIPAEMPTEIPAEIPAEMPEEPTAPIKETADPEDSIKSTLDKKEVSSDVINSDSQVNLSDAILKLEEVAGRLSDRKTIRLLAEFDIILDRIGIAGMFPEIVEAQSKLIDGYSYALTRVTKMLGMLSSGKDLSEITETKKQEFAYKTMKEVNKTFEKEPEDVSTPEESIQDGLQEADLSPKPITPTPKPEKLPAAKPI
jgi:hypothetical protein